MFGEDARHSNGWRNNNNSGYKSARRRTVSGAAQLPTPCPAFTKTPLDAGSGMLLPQLRSTGSMAGKQLDSTRTFTLRVLRTHLFHFLAQFFRSLAFFFVALVFFDVLLGVLAFALFL